MAQKFYNESDIQAIASAIRAKNGLSSTYKVSQMASAIQNIPSGSGGGGNTDIEDSLVTRTISGVYENSRVTKIGSWAFFSCSALTSVSFPQATSIGVSAFQYCSALTSVNFPQVTTIGTSAFYACFTLTSISFPQAKFISNNTFYSCTALTSVNFPQVIRISAYAFQNCTALTSVILPQVNYISNYAFGNCSALTSVFLGGRQSQSGELYNTCFSRCYNLINLTLYDGEDDDNNYFYSLMNSNAFNSTPIAGYSVSAGQYGSIYVPASLYSQYISATNWTYFSSRIVSF